MMNMIMMMLLMMVVLDMEKAGQKQTDYA